VTNVERAQRPFGRWSVLAFCFGHSRLRGSGRASLILNYQSTVNTPLRSSFVCLLRFVHAKIKRRSPLVIGGGENGRGRWQSGGRGPAQWALAASSERTNVEWVTDWSSLTCTAQNVGYGIYKSSISPTTISL